MSDALPEVPPFTASEFALRLQRASAVMMAQRLDAMVLTSEANIEYLSGFETQFAWNTPTRPWYFLVPREGDPVALIPEIGESNWRATSWCTDIVTWPSPRPADEGISLLCARLAALPRRFGRVGFETGPESRLGMPVADFLRLALAVREEAGLELDDASAAMNRLRAIKSPAEIARIRHICAIAGRSFAELPQFIAAGDSEKTIVRRFSASLLLNGADKVPYAAIVSGPGGYDSIISGPTDRRLAAGDVLIIDTGARAGGYFCDFDRNFSVGAPADEVRRVHETLWQATQAGIAAVRPGVTAAQVFAAQAGVLDAAGYAVGTVGRFGHGLGKLLTEQPSLAPGDDTPLRAGMVLAIEPSAGFGNGRIMAHEENVVVTPAGAELLTPRAPRELPVIG